MQWTREDVLSIFFREIVLHIIIIAETTESDRYLRDQDALIPGSFN